jgi:hypothetical protein
LLASSRAVCAARIRLVKTHICTALLLCCAPGWSFYYDEVNFNKSKKAAGKKPQQQQQQQQQLVPSMAFEVQESRKEV